MADGLNGIVRDEDGSAVASLNLAVLDEELGPDVVQVVEMALENDLHGLHFTER